MVLDTKEFIPTITDLGVEQLYHYVTAIIRKKLPTINQSDLEELQQIAVLRCLEKISTYDTTKNNQLGGYLAIQVRGAITMFLYNNKKHSVVADTNQTDNLEYEEKSYELGSDKDIDYSSILKYYGVSPKYNGLIGDIVKAILECEDVKEKKNCIKQFKKQLKRGWFSR